MTLDGSRADDAPETVRESSRPGDPRSVWLAAPNERLPMLPRLPGFDPPEQFRETCSALKGEVELWGWHCRFRNTEVVTGAAAGSVDEASVRAWGKFVERAGTFYARTQTERHFEGFTMAGAPVREVPSSELFLPDPEPELERRALSVGIATHTDWQLACRAALLELYERDALARAWRGMFNPKKFEAESLNESLILHTHDVDVYRMGPARFSSTLAQFVHAVLAVAWPKSAEAPFTVGSAAAPKGEHEAVVKALFEAEQGVAFLTGESFGEEERAPAPSPGFHQAYYQRPEHREALRPWLRGEGKEASPGGVDALAWDAYFVDLTPLEWRGRLYIVKAMAPAAQSLGFGPGRGARSALPHPFA